MNKKIKKLILEVKLKAEGKDLNEAIFESDFSDDEIIELCKYFKEELDWEDISRNRYKSFRFLREFRNDISHNIMLNTVNDDHISKHFLRISRYNSNLYGKDTGKKCLSLFDPNSIKKLKEIRNKEIIKISDKAKGKKNYDQTVTIFKEGKKMTLTLREIERIRDKVYTL